jgi:hypothetical protein
MLCNGRRRKASGETTRPPPDVGAMLVASGLSLALSSH